MTHRDLVPLREALFRMRKARAFTQGQMADALAISRKTYVRFENCAWLPSARERGYFVKRLHDLDPAAAEALVRVAGETFEQHTLVRQPPAVAGGAPLDAAQAKLLFDAAVYAAAEDLDLSPKAVRPIAANLLARLAAAGMPIGQAAALAKGALGGAKKTTA